MKTQNNIANPNYQAWEKASKLVDAADIGSSDIAKFALQFGILAPSVHNTQPWKFEIQNKQIFVIKESARVLTVGDPTGRETWISLGCCVQNIVFALQSFGIRPEVTIDDEAAGKIKIHWTNEPAKLVCKDKGILKSMLARQSYRFPFTNEAIEQRTLIDLEKSWKKAGTTIKTSEDPKIIQATAGMSSQAISAAMNRKDFSQETLDLLHGSGTRGFTGIPAKALGISTYSLQIQKLKNQINSVAKSEQSKEFKLLSNAAAVAYVFSKGDVPKYWLDAGRAYESLALRATSLGIAHSTHAAMVEGPEYHKEAAELFNTQGRLLAVVRLGKKPAEHSVAHTPRLDLESVML